MKAIVFDNELKLDKNYDKPVPAEGEPLIRVTLAGICNTDFEITKGYMGYVGILGHEFVGIVEEVNGADQSWVGKRVVAEISYVLKRIPAIVRIDIPLVSGEKTDVLQNT